MSGAVCGTHWAAHEALGRAWDVGPWVGWSAGRWPLCETLGCAPDVGPRAGHWGTCGTVWGTCGTLLAGRCVLGVQSLDHVCDANGGECEKSAAQGASEPAKKQFHARRRFRASAAIVRAQ